MPRRHILSCLLVVVGCTGEPEEESPWLVPQQDLGAAVAVGEGMDMTGDDAWRMAEQVIPGLAWDAPALDIAEEVFAQMLADRGISDEGTCPYTVAEGASQTWVSNCRSQDGYEWAGTFTRTDGTEEGMTWSRWEMDLEVIGEQDFTDLERVTLRGQIYAGRGDGSTDLISVLQTNVEVGVVEYREALNGTTDELAIWSDWRLTARYEEHQARLLVSGQTDLGGYGGAGFEGLALVRVADCPTEVDGILSLSSGPADARLAFDGSAGCDRCGQLVVDGQDAGQACPP